MKKRKKRSDKKKRDGMTAGRRGEIERNAFERSHEFTSFFFFLKKKEMNYEAYFLSLLLSVCVYAYKRQGRLSFFLGLCLFFFSGKEEEKRL